MPRFLQALALFAAGAAFSWLVTHPATVVVERQDLSVPRETSREASAPQSANIGEDAEVGVGIPPESVTLPKSHPSAGRKRALARALDALEQGPTEPPPVTGNPELAAELAAKIRNHFLRQGDLP